MFFSSSVYLSLKVDLSQEGKDLWILLFSCLWLVSCLFSEKKKCQNCIVLQIYLVAFLISRQISNCYTKCHLLEFSQDVLSFELKDMSFFTLSNATFNLHMNFLWIEPTFLWAADNNTATSKQMQGRLRASTALKRKYTLSAQIQHHSWIEPHSIQNVIQPQSKIDFDTIQAQLEYNPTLANFGIFK